MHDSSKGHMLSSKYQPLASDQGEFGIKGKQNDVNTKKEKKASKLLLCVDNMVNNLGKILETCVEKNTEPIVIDESQSKGNKNIEYLPLNKLLMLS